MYTLFRVLKKLWTYTGMPFPTFVRAIRHSFNRWYPLNANQFNEHCTIFAFIEVTSTLYYQQAIESLMQQSYPISCIYVYNPKSIQEVSDFCILYKHIRLINSPEKKLANKLTFLINMSAPDYCYIGNTSTVLDADFLKDCLYYLNAPSKYSAAHQQGVKLSKNIKIDNYKQGNALPLYSCLLQTKYLLSNLIFLQEDIKTNNKITTGKSHYYYFV